jgi:glycosyltransferase involved in cell wall biosynthesis
MPNLSIDVVIPAYNASRFIEETIRSLLAQTYLPRKIIIVDDGSTDNTVEIIKSFKSELIELISVENGGVSRARNIGIKASEAEYVSFLDADDIWEPSKLEAQLRQLKQKPEAGVCYAGSQLINDAGVEIKNTTGTPYVRGKVFEDIVFYERPIYGSASSVIVSRDILLQTDLFDETMQFSEDVDLWAHLALLTEFEYVTQPYVKIRVHSYSATRNKSWKKDLKIVLQHFYYLNKFANTYSIPRHMIRAHKNRIIRLFFNYPSKLTCIYTFYTSLKNKSPHLADQMGYKTFPFFMLNIFCITAREAFYHIRTRAVPFQRLKLLFLEGTIFFSKSKNHNPNVEFVRKKR